ncbi:MAG: hypothetical protein GOMPHAMPRED_005416 [Gomphillus americanus]|uniref:Bacteriophage T5 Orf172 DNA-binding domain-containing protein n=1 Tax=Gomphillus americanus TaxID=1940652 RepID=A0A8H3FT20_9LECA|nr:MAG: hypothetical protein GOMPHAMPRED_005416 [Gomphillus americanus]
MAITSPSTPPRSSSVAVVTPSTPPSTASKAIPKEKPKEVSGSKPKEVSKETISKEAATANKVPTIGTNEISTAYITPPASPSPPARTLPRLQSVTSEVQLQSITIQEPKYLSVKTIADKLKIEKWLCGAQGGRGSCRWEINNTEKEPHKRDKIESLIKDLSLADTSSTAFDPALEELAKSYSCHLHHSGTTLEHKLTEWRDKLIPPTRIQGRVRAALWKPSVKCLVCDERIGGQRVQNCQMTSNLVLEHSGNIEYCTYLLRVWDANSRCDLHSGRKDEARIIRLVAMIQAIATTTFSSSIDENPDMSKPIQSFWLSAQLTNSFKSSKWDDPNGETDPLKILKSTVKAPLIGENLKKGFVYIYKVDGNPGRFKIGYTANLEARRKKWEFHCNRKCSMLYHKEVPNAKRVEALCHSDLHENRVQVYCDGCITNHNEWFEVSLDEAKATLDKWATWMIKSNPYDTRGLKSGNEFLKDATVLDDMEAFKKDPMAKCQ